MSDFVYDNLPLPSTKSDKNGVPGSEDVTKWWAAADANGYRTIVNSMRTALLAGQWQGLVNASSAPVSAANSVSRRSNNGFEELSENGSTWFRTQTKFNVQKYGCPTTGVDLVDNASAIHAAIVAARANGGGVVYFPNAGGKPYRIDSQIVNGVRFVNEADVTLIALGYPSGSYSSESAASWDGTAATAASGLAAVSFEFEPGAGLWWGGSEPVVETAMLYMGIINPASGGNIMNHFLRGGYFLGPTEYTTSGGFAPLGGTTPVTTNVSAVFIPGTAEMHVEYCTAYGVNRGFTMSDNYWSQITLCQVFRCIDGFTMFNHNAARAVANIVSYASGNGHIISGGGWRMEGAHAQECPCAINIPSADAWRLTHAYIESHNTADADTYVKIGQNGGGTNATWGTIDTLSISPGGAAAKLMELQSVFGISILDTRLRFLNLTNNPVRINDTNCLLINFVNSNVPLDAATTGNATIMGQCSFYNSSYDTSNFITDPGTLAKFLLTDRYARPGGAIVNHSNVANGSGAIAHVLDTDHTLSTAGAIHTQGKNNGTEIYRFDKDGGLLAQGASEFVNRLMTDAEFYTAGSRRKHRANYQAASSYTLGDTDEVVASSPDAFSGDITITAKATAQVGKTFTMAGGFQATHKLLLAPASGEALGRAPANTSMPIAPDAWVQFMSNGAGLWDVVGYKPGAWSLAATGTIPPTAGVVLLDATAGNMVATLPNPATTVIGAVMFFKRKDSTGHTCTLARFGSEAIDGVASDYTMGAAKYLVLFSDGSSWWNVGSN